MYVRTIQNKACWGLACVGVFVLQVLDGQVGGCVRMYECRRGMGVGVHLRMWWHVCGMCALSQVWLILQTATVTSSAFDCGYNASSD